MSPWRRRLLFGIPLVLAAAGGEAFYTILRRMQKDDYDPHALPSPLIGKRPPSFVLPGINGAPGITAADLTAPPKPMLVNWFASWCAPCREEAPILASLAAAGLSIWGIAYEDDPQAVAQFLSQSGNPYQRLAADADGATAINWGVYGVPESYLIDKNGIIRWRYAKPLTAAVVAAQLNPLLAKYA